MYLPSLTYLDNKNSLMVVNRERQREIKTRLSQQVITTSNFWSFQTGRDLTDNAVAAFIFKSRACISQNLNEIDTYLASLITKFQCHEVIVVCEPGHGDVVNK